MRYVHSALVVLLMLALGGCTTVLHRRDGSQLEGRIERADADTVYFETEAGERVAVPREQIEKVDHAGSTAVIVSGVLTGVSALGLLVSAIAIADAESEQARCAAIDGDDCENWTTFTVMIFGVLPSVAVLVPSAGTLIGALVVRADSVERFEGPRPGDVELGVAPWLAPEDGGARGGVAATVRF